MPERRDGSRRSRDRDAEDEGKCGEETHGSSPAMGRTGTSTGHDQLWHAAESITLYEPCDERRDGLSTRDLVVSYAVPPDP
jgi:hypothetical protein